LAEELPDAGRELAHAGLGDFASAGDFDLTQTGPGQKVTDGGGTGTIGDGTDFGRTMAVFAITHGNAPLNM
jgi:hypothetical protein